MGSIEDWYYATGDDDGEGGRNVAVQCRFADPDTVPIFHWGAAFYGSLGGVWSVGGVGYRGAANSYSGLTGVTGTSRDFTGVAGTSRNRVGVYGQVGDRIVGRRKDIKRHRRFAKIELPAPARAPRKKRRPQPSLRAIMADLEKQTRPKATARMRKKR